MPDDLSDEEMLLILDHIEKHGVTKCPPCTFSEEAGAPRQMKAMDFRKKNKPTPETLQRWAKVRELADGVRTATQIASALGVPVHMIHTDAQRMRKKGWDVPLPHPFRK